MDVVVYIATMCVAVTLFVIAIKITRYFAPKYSMILIRTDQEFRELQTDLTPVFLVAAR